MLEIVGYFLAIIIGVSLGLIGGGGSILTIPVLVFCFGIDPVLATTYSLFIVGISAISGSLSYYKMGNIDYKAVWIFGIPSVIVLVIMRRYLLPLMPATIFHFGSVVVSKSLLVLFVFSMLMLFSGWSMIRRTNYMNSTDQLSNKRLALQGVITGGVTGFIGIGGGFIIVPSLVLFAGLPMKRAIGTSLCIITINCIVGILSNMDSVSEINFRFLATFSVFSIVGILLGTWLTRHFSDKKLKPIFGWIILAMSLVMFARIFMNLGS
jgi:uncharacterized membrane protein YfcA